MLEEAVSFSEPEQTPPDTRPLMLCREAKEEANENPSSLGKDYVQPLQRVQTDLL